MDFISILSIFVLAYFIVWRVTPEVARTVDGIAQSFSRFCRAGTPSAQGDGVALSSSKA